MKPVVNFIIVGAAKSGTTSLAHLLSLHPGICMSKPKELYYFNQNIDWNDPDKLASYHSHFHEYDGKVTGEASTLYSDFPRYLDTEKRIYTYNPDMKIIFIMRHPVKRMYSHYKHMYAMSKLTLPVERMEEELLTNPLFINRSRYYMQIIPYIRLFGRDNVFLTFFEEFTNNPIAILSGICDFLKVDSAFYHSGQFNFHHNASENLRILTPWGDIIASLPVIRHLPRSVKWRFRKLFERKIIQFPPLSEHIQRHLLHALESDIEHLQEICEKDIYKLWKIAPV